jgi:mannosyltransferase OCH1-like enzyme
MYQMNREYIANTRQRRIMIRPIAPRHNSSIIHDVRTRTQHSTNIRYRHNIDFVNGNPNQQTRLIDKKFDSIKCYISLTTHSSRFYTDDFIEVLKCLSNQTILPDKIYLSICSKYIRKFTDFKSKPDHIARIEYIKQRFPLIEVIEESTDRGPATKLLGLLEFNKTANILRENDLIIVTDDDMLYSRDLVASHLTCYHLYNCDVIAVDEARMIRTWHPYTFNISDTFYRDQYTGFLYGWLSFAITYRAVKIKGDIEQFYMNIIKKFPDVIYHDDLLFSLYMYLNKLYTVENRFITLLHDLEKNRDLYKIDPVMIDRYGQSKRNQSSVNARTGIDSVNPLRDMVLSSGLSKYDLENIVYLDYKITLVGKSYKSCLVDYIISKNLPCRDIILVDNLKLISWPENIHVSFVYIDSQSTILTVTVFDDSLAGTDAEIIFSVNDIQYSVIVNIEKKLQGFVYKFSHVVYFVNASILPKSHSNPKNLTVVQTSASTQMTKNRFNSISTLLINSPEFPYQFFDDADVFNFVQDNYTDIIYDAITNLIPGAYVSDVFRYCYLYLNGGVYMDCKKIVFVPVSDYINNFINVSASKTTDIFIKDGVKNYSYNAIMVCDKFSKVMEIALVYSIYKIVKNSYDKDPLCITGPGCLGDAIDYIYEARYPYYYFNITPKNKKDHHWLSFIVDKSNRSVIKNTYFGYYDEGNYKSIGHYAILWQRHKIYKNDLSTKYKNITKMLDIVMFKK